MALFRRFNGSPIAGQRQTERKKTEYMRLMACREVWKTVISHNLKARDVYMTYSTRPGPFVRLRHGHNHRGSMQPSGALDFPSYWATGSIKARTERGERHRLPRWGHLRALHVVESR